MVLCSVICNVVEFNPFGFEISRPVSGFSQILLGWNILMYFSSEITRPGSIARHHFGTVALCPQKIRKFIAETNVQKVYITFESQGLGCDQDLMVFLTRTQYQYTVIKLMLFIMRGM